MRNVYFLASLFLCLILTLELLSQAVLADTDAAASPGNVNIVIDREGVHPKSVQLKSGSTVVWVNRTGAPVQVRFTVDPISTICRSPRGFDIHSRGIEASRPISSNDIASICLLEPGSVQYEVDIVGGNKSIPNGEASEIASTKIFGELNVQ